MMLVTSTESIAGQRVTETLGLVRGSSIRTRHVFADMAEFMRNLVGLELHHYNKMMAEAREQALDRMRADAHRVGADAVVAVRFATSAIASGASEMLAYGTGVKLITCSED